MTDVAAATEEQILQFRARARAGEELTEEELRSALLALRAKRRTAAEQAGKKSSKSGPVRSPAELMSLFSGQATDTKQE